MEAPREMVDLTGADTKRLVLTIAKPTADPNDKHKDKLAAHKRSRVAGKKKKHSDGKPEPKAKLEVEVIKTSPPVRLLNLLNYAEKPALTQKMIWKFDRKTRDYKRMYIDLHAKIKSGEFTYDYCTYHSLEMLRKTYKDHGYVLEMDRKFDEDDSFSHSVNRWQRIIN